MIEARSPWLFSQRLDLVAFGLPLVVSLLLVLIGMATGLASDDLPEGLWLVAVLGVDVSHVWSTIFRVYADQAEVRRRPWLYVGAPLATYALGVGIHLWWGAAGFWRVLAYGAVFHFVRQQYGWVRWYGRKQGPRSAWAARVDTAAVYLASVAPLLWWHAHLPRRFHWFVDGDFLAGLPERVGDAAMALQAAALLAYVAVAAAERPVAWGKHLVVLSTVLCWDVGIVAFDSDFVFSVTNVLIHGVPYFVLIWVYGSRRYAAEATWTAGLFRLGGWAVYGLLVAIALVEEGAWDKLVWHDHPGIFGEGGFALTPVLLALVTPLLALPQATHYVLDGFIWRVGPKNPGLGAHL